MAIKLMYITNNPDVAAICQDAGVDRIFIDMEYIGKSDRQGGMDTVQSHHTIEDIKKIRKVVTTSELMVRVNPIHEATNDYTSSEEEINAVIEAGADVIMLPYFKTAKEVKRFVDIVDGRAKVFPLLETKEAVAELDEILAIPGIDEMHIGINDLCLSQKKTFMFELLSDGTVEAITKKIKDAGIPYGFGGIAAIGTGLLKADYILSDHYRLGSTRVILSRSFCNTSVITDLDEIREIFTKGVADIRSLEQEYATYSEEQFLENQKKVAQGVAAVVEIIKNRKS